MTPIWYYTITFIFVNAYPSTNVARLLTGLLHLLPLEDSLNLVCLVFISNSFLNKSLLNITSVWLIECLIFLI